MKAAAREFNRHYLHLWSAPVMPLAEHARAPARIGETEQPDSHRRRRHTPKPTLDHGLFHACGVRTDVRRVNFIGVPVRVHGSTCSWTIGGMLLLQHSF